MIGRILLVNLGAIFVFMTLVFAVARTKQRLDTVDVSWGLGFIVVSWLTVVQVPSWRSLAVAGLVSVWGLRLAAHIYQRTTFRGDDPRYRELAAKWRGNFWVRAYFSVFLLQGGLIWIISLPVVLVNGQEIAGAWLFAGGAAVWAAGFITEATADRQLQKFLRSQQRPAVLQTGLWHYSRHPNYFGEITLWWGIAIMALSAQYGWVGLAGPLLLTYLIVCVSGLPPIERRRADNPAYQAYKRRTSPLIPLPPRRR